MVRSKPAACSSCKLCSAGSDFSQPEGLGLLGVALIGEANGEAEARDQLPFRSYAPSGAILERTLRRLGYTRDQFAISNVLRCRPFSNELAGTSYEFEVIESCKPNLLAFLRQFQPKVIVALGGVAFRTLTGISGPMRLVSHSRGYVFRALPDFCVAACTADLLVVPTYHPAFLRRGAIHLTGVLARDIQRAVNIRQGKDRSFILEPPPETSDFYDDTKFPSEQARSYEEAEALRDEAVAAWLKRYNLRYNLRPTRAELDNFCRDVKARSDAWLALSPDERRYSLLALSHDLETYESASLDEDESDGYTDTQVRLSQFSIEPGQAIALDWTPEHAQATRWLLKLPLPKVGQNYWLFDWRVLRAVGQRDFGDREFFRPAGQVHDTMQQFHFFQPDLPAHLQYAASYAQFPLPWKHLAGTNLPLYGCFDPDAALRVHHVTFRTMVDRGIWFDPDPARDAVGYKAQVEDVRPVLERMEDRGLPINDARRLALGKEFDAVYDELFKELDARFPNAARRVTPKEKGEVKGYSGIPPELKTLLAEIAPLAASPYREVEDAKGKKIWVDESDSKVTKKLVERMAKEAQIDRAVAVTSGETAADIALRHTIAARVFVDPPEIDEEDGSEIPGETYRYEVRRVGQVMLDENLGIKSAGEARWVRVYSFSPNSSAQLMDYMRVRGHKVPYDKKRGSETTSKKELERLGAKHHDDFYAKVIECREMRRMSSTYVDGFRPGVDGRVHTTFTFATATQQTSSRQPNTQNYPAHGKLGKAIKSMIEAPEGFELANWDKKSFHVIITGLLAEDSEYMRFARLDMHSFVTWHFLKLPGASTLHDLPDEELLEKFAWLKSNADYKRVRDKQSKPSILGIALGLMPPHLYEMNREHFESQRQATQFREVIQGLFPKVFRWQDAVCEEAHKNQVLVNRFSALRWFYEVKAPDSRGGWKPGEQWNAALALKVQSEAHGELRENLKALDREGAAEKYGLNNTIHDSFQFCYPVGLRAQMLHEVGEILLRPSKVLIHPVLAPGGLVVGVECGIGKNMAELEEVKLPADLLASA